VFPLLGTYWTQADTLVHYVAMQEGGYDKLKGKRIAFIYHDSPYGKEPIPVFQALSKLYGFELEMYPVTPPGLEQKSTWLQLARQFRPDWTFMWGWGVMNSTAIKEAAAIGYPRDHFIGVWWSGAEPDVIPRATARSATSRVRCMRPAPWRVCTKTSSRTCTTKAKAPRNARRSDRCSTTAA
jgi:branched-chain amino acid transport system substrate-binding protein